MQIGSEQFNELLQFEVSRMAKSMKLTVDDPLFAFLRMAKITEEVGELSDCLQGEFGFLRPQKQEKYEHLELEHELADVLISTMLLATILDIDIQKVVNEKMQIIMNRPYAGSEKFLTSCECGKVIECEIGPNGGIIENEDFNLWGPLALCKECDTELSQKYNDHMASTKPVEDTMEGWS